MSAGTFKVQNALEIPFQACEKSIFNCTGDFFNSRRVLYERPDYLRELRNQYYSEPFLVSAVHMNY